MSAVGALHLPFDAGSAAQLCLAARLPVDSAGSIRLRARWAAALATELNDCAAAIGGIASSTEWAGAAAKACHDRLTRSAPNFSTTAQRHSDYATVLLTYASGLDGLAPSLANAKTRVAAAEQSCQDAAFHAGLGKYVAGVGPVAPGFAPTFIANPVADRASQIATQELLDRCREFAALYNDWVALLQRCIAGISAADGADPTRDLHGWRWIGAHVSSAAHWSTDWSWAKVSATLNVVSSVLAVVAVCLLPVVPALAGILFLVAAGLSFAQCLVDLERKEVQHDNSVSWGAIAVDFIGALPLAGMGTELKATSRGVAGAVRSSGDSAHSFSAGAAELGAQGRLVKANFVKNPARLWTGDPAMRRDTYRSMKYGGASGLARRWAWPVTYIVPDSVLGFPGVPGPPSEEQGASAEVERLNFLATRHAGTSGQPGDLSRRRGNSGASTRGHNYTGSSSNSHRNSGLGSTHEVGRSAGRG